MSLYLTLSTLCGLYLYGCVCCSGGSEQQRATASVVEYGRSENSRLSLYSED